jgi:hypothetical protein
MLADAQASYLRALFVTGLIATTSLTAASAAPASPSQKTSPAQKAQIVEDYGKLPLSFEGNTGQADKSVKFLSRGSGYGLYLTGNEAVLTLRKTVYGAARPGLQRKLRPIQRSAPSDVVRMQLTGASGKAEPMGVEQLPGTANYFIGNDPAKWHTSVPTYAKVRYTGIYPGIDLLYYGNQRQLECDFVVAPGVDPKPIRLRFAGAKELHLAADGDLVVTAANGALAFHKPLVYQIVDGHRHTVEGDFALLAKHTVGFRLGSYNHAKALVIDPVLVYSTYLGGSGRDTANAITVDTAGNAYVAGQTSSTDFPVTPGAFQTTDHAAANGTFTAFVTKLNPTGTALVYSTYLGGSGIQNGSGDSARGLAVDSSGNAYVIGSAGSTDFPVTQGAFQTMNRAAANDDANAFVAKLNPSGTALVYSTYVGGSGLSADTPYSGDKGNAIAVDAAGDAYVAGETFSVDFPVTPGAYQTTNNAAATKLSNAFVTELNPAGTALVYSTYLGGSGGRLSYAGDIGNAIAVDLAGDVVVAGETFSTDFPVTPGAYQTTNNAAANESTNAFVTKLNPTGTALVYSTYLGGSGGDIGSAIAVDTASNVYVAGQTGSTDFPVTTGAFQTTDHAAAKGLTNAFVTKLNPTGTALVYSSYLGGSGGIINLMPTLGELAGDQASGLAVDISANVYVTGSTASANFPVTQVAYQTTNHDQSGCVGGCIGGYNAFITELNSTGSALVYSTYMGGSGINPMDFVGVLEFGDGDQANALALDSSGNVYVTGSAVSYDFPVTAGAFQTAVNSRSGNAFVTKLNMGATSTATTPTVTVTPASSTITSARPLTVTVSVSGGGDNPTPTGTVTLASGTYTSAATTLNGGSATIVIPAGSLLAEPPGYGGDGLIAKYVPDTASSSTYNSASGLGSVTVVAADISVTPSSSYLTTAQSQSQALPVAMVATGGTGNPVPTGTVTLTIGSYSSAVTALSGGSATISIPPATLTTGFNTLDVSYSGDGNYAAVAIAGSALVTVGPVTVSVAPSSSSISSTQPLPVTITLSAGSGNPTPTGMVILTSGSYSSLGTQLVGGVATITIPAGTLAPGVDILTAQYLGGGNYLGGASGQASLTVTAGTPTFTITGTAVTVTAGATTGNTSTITVTPAGGFTGSVALTAAVTSSPGGAQSLPTLSFGGTSPVSITGATAGTATLAIFTTPSNCAPGNLIDLRVPWYPAGAAALACLLLFGIPGRRRSWRRTLAMLALLVTLAGGMLACGGGGSARNCPPATTAGTYTVTVTGTSGSTTATGTVTLNVM